ASIDAGLTDLHPAAVDPLGMDEMVQQRTVAAADIEHPRLRRDHLGDQLQIDADAARRRGGAGSRGNIAVGQCCHSLLCAKMPDSSPRALTLTLSRFAVEGTRSRSRSAGVPSTAKRERVRVRVCDTV